MTNNSEPRSAKVGGCIVDVRWRFRWRLERRICRISRATADDASGGSQLICRQDTIHELTQMIRADFAAKEIRFSCDFYLRCVVRHHVRTFHMGRSRDPSVDQSLGGEEIAIAKEG